MNERIQELEDQCWEDIPVDIDYDYLSRVRRVFNREKFAELIVAEMLDITDAHTEVFQTDRDRALIEHIKQSVKTHFGVEE